MSLVAQWAMVFDGHTTHEAAVTSKLGRAGMFVGRFPMLSPVDPNGCSSRDAGYFHGAR